MIQFRSTVRVKPLVPLVEDELDVRELLAELLNCYGHPVTTATNRSEALTLLRNTPLPGVILRDSMMPIMSGWELVAGTCNPIWR